MKISSKASIERLRQLIDKIQSMRAMGLSMRLRLFVFFMLLVMTMVVGVMSLLLITGTFSTGIGENRRLMENELAHISQNVERQFGEISAQALRLSRHIARNVEGRLREKGLDVDDLRYHSELLEGIVDDQYDTLFFSMERAKASGAFMILNATASKRPQEARVSRAGLYFKNWEPNIQSESSPAILVLRGFSRIARKHEAVLDAQWAMEFDIENAPYYSLPQKAAAENPAFTRRLCYWQPATNLQGASYYAMLCSVPLIDSNGTVFGVCGFEMSDTLFKITYMPTRNLYGGAFCALAPIRGNALDMSRALFSWRYNVEREPRSGRALEVENGNVDKDFTTYRQRGGGDFVGLQKTVALYAKDSPFAREDEYALALLVPKAGVDAKIAADNARLLSLSLLLLFVGAVCSFVFSKWYIRPVLVGLDTIRSGVRGRTGERTTRVPRTKISEIDDLIEFLSRQNEEPEGAGGEDVAAVVGRSKPGRLPEDVFELFLENTKTLTRAERSVFNLYVEGYAAQDIAQILNLSINTIKTHNRRIFMKLNVSSRKELLAYVQMLQEAGRAVR